MTSSLPSIRPPAPQLSISLTTWSAEPTDWQSLFDLAVAADVAGVDRLAMSDHVVFGEHMEAYGDASIGGQEGGVQPTGPDGNWLEPVTTLAVLAGMTTRVRLCTWVLLAALRRPVTLAKELSTLDVLSKGRLDLGVGVGWQREEYEAAGLPFESRGKLLDHTLEVCQTFWSDMRCEYHGHGLDFEAIHMMPKPTAPGGVPVWVSGTVNKNVARRLARFGQGWMPWGDAWADLKTAVEQMGELLDAEGRDIKDLAITAIVPLEFDANGIDLARSLENVPALVEAGATDLRLWLAVPEGRSAATDFLSDVVAQFRATVGRKD